MLFIKTVLKSLFVLSAAVIVAGSATIQHANAYIEHQLPLTVQSSGSQLILSGTIPAHCNDLAVYLMPDYADYFIIYESGYDFTINSDRSWTADLSQAKARLNNGVHNIGLASKCGAVSYDDPTYLDYYVDAFTVLPGACDANCVPVHRFYNYTSGAHFYTANEHEKRILLERWTEFRYEGISSFAKGGPEAGLAPVFRFYNLKLDVHFYTVNSHEAANVRATLSQTYRDEGVAYYTNQSKTADNVAVFRFYNLQKGVHFYTSDTNEAAHIRATASGTFRDEGVAFHNIANN